MPRALQVCIDALGRDGVEWQVAQFPALAVDLQVLDTATLLDVTHHEQRRFLAPQAVIQQHDQNGPIAQALERRYVRCIEDAL